MSSRNSSKHLVIERRRQFASSLRLRGLSVREVVLALAESRELNPDTGQPWGQATIHADIKASEAEWRRLATQEISEHKALLNAELVEIKRASWQAKDTAGVLKAIEQQRKMLGIDSPQQTQIGGIPGGEPIQTANQGSIIEGIDLAKLTPDQLEGLERAVVLIDRLRAGSGTPADA